MKKILFFSLVAASLAACSKDEVEGPSSAAPEATKITITADHATSRTDLQGDGRTVVWSKGDRIGVYCEYKGSAGTAAIQDKQTIFTLAETSAGHATGTFDGELDFSLFDEETCGGEGGDYRYCAYYPANDAYTGKKGAVEQTLAPVQTFDAAAETFDLSKNDLLVGRNITVKSQTDPVPITFIRVFAMMQFAVKNETGEPFRLQKIEMTAEDGKALTGSYKINVNNAYIPGGDKLLYSGGRPTFTSGSNTLTVNVDNGIVAAGETLDVKSIFNRWENLDGTTVTLRVTTSKGVYETAFAGKDYSASDNWRKTVTVDELTPDTAEGTVDNYIEGSMTLATLTTDIGTGTNQANWAKNGIYCIGEDLSFANVCQVRCTDLTIIGRYVINGMPQQKLTSTITMSANLPENANVVLKDLVLSPLCDASKSATFTLLRFNGVKYALNSITIDNCVIEIPSTLAAKTDPLIPLCGAGHGIKNIVFKNCIFRNINPGTHAIIGINNGDGDTDIESLTIENCTFYNTEEINLSQSMIALSTCPDMTLRNNTIYNYAGSDATALVKLSSGALVWKDNIVSTSSASGAFVFSSLANVTAEGNVYDNCAEVKGGEARTVDGLFRDAAAADFTVVSGEVPAGCGDQRWW